MNKAELVSKMAEKSELTKKEAEAALNAFMKSVEEALVEENEIEEVFEDVVVHQGKQLRMVLNDYGDTCDACDIEQIGAYQAQRGEPQLLLPWTASYKHDNNPDKCLF